MKSKEEIANKHGILSGKDSEFDDAILNAMQEYANQCQEDMADKKYTEEEVIELLQKALTHQNDAEIGNLVTIQKEIRPANFYSWFNKFKKLINKQD